MAESSQILDNSFLSSQPHLTEHVSSLNYQACMDIATAIYTYKEYVATMEEMMIVQEQEQEDMVNQLEELNMLADDLFKKEQI